MVMAKLAEYSIRSAQTAVYSLLGMNRTPSRVYKGSHDPRVLLKAFLTLHEIHAHASESSGDLKALEYVDFLFSYEPN
jgi:myosin-crossreactive antigen